jgi:hypothetical protein
MQFPSESQGKSVLNSLFYSTRFFYNNSNPTSVRFVYEVNSLLGDLDYFYATTSYLNTPYISNISGVVGGGIIEFNITGFNITQQNFFNVTIGFKRFGFSEFTAVVPFIIEYYPSSQYTAYTGLFTLQELGVAGRAIIGTIILLFIVAGIWSLTSSSEASMVAGAIVTGLFSVPAIGLFPMVFGIITVSVIVIILIGDSVVNR